MKLKHIAGDNLCDLEQRLDKLGALVKSIVSISWNCTICYIHYIEADSEPKKEPDKKVEADKPAGVKNASKSKNI